MTDEDEEQTIVKTFRDVGTFVATARSLNISVYKAHKVIVDYEKNTGDLVTRSRRGPEREDYTGWLESYRKSNNFAAVAREFGVSRQRVYQIIQRNLDDPHGKILSGDPDAEKAIRKLFARYRSRIIGVQNATIKRISRWLSDVALHLLPMVQRDEAVYRDWLTGEGVFSSTTTMMVLRYLISDIDSAMLWLYVDCVNFVIACGITEADEAKITIAKKIIEETRDAATLTIDKRATR